MADSQDRPSNKKTQSIAVLGTMSDAGKSIMAAGICRIFSNKGVQVAPFKAQNMSNNASPALLPDWERRKELYESFHAAVGSSSKTAPEAPHNATEQQGYGEIGTAQALQAEACRLVPRVEMNPLLLKSGGRNKHGEYLCRVMVLGKQIVLETYGELGKRTTSMKNMVLQSHRALAQATDADVIVLEGAGSCTELNLMDRDIVNIPLVRALDCHWLLVANIDCGGVFGQIVGTKACLSEKDWSLCKGVIVNKLRGEAKYFEPGPKMLEKMIQKPVFVVPYLENLNLPEEDGVGIERRLAREHSHDDTKSEKDRPKKPVVVVVAYPHIAIADDLCPLENDSRFDVQWRRSNIPKPYPHTTAVVLPGSTLTRLDLKWLNDSGWAKFLQKHVTAGGVVLGICGGYQMMGWTVKDPTATEGTAGANKALGLLPVETIIQPIECKIVRPQRGRLYPSKIPIAGFELHCGRSDIVRNLGGARTQGIHPLLVLESGRPEGMISGNVKGTYMHGVLRTTKARVELLIPDKKEFPGLMKEGESEVDPLDRLAHHLEDCGLTYEVLNGMLKT
jgi:adenosylcobyric acid synthase